MKKAPFSTHRIIAALTLAFLTGTGAGYLLDNISGNHLQSSILQHSPLLQRIAASSEIARRTGELMAYHTSDDGELVEDLAGDDLEDPSINEPAHREKPATPPPAIIKPARIEKTPITDCTVPDVEKPEYKATPINSKRVYKGIAGESVTVSIIMQNTGNLPWLSEKSGCSITNPLQLGTARERDRESIFYSDVKDSGWIAPNRVMLRTARVNPGEAGVFEFVAKLPRIQDIYREYFSVVIPGIQWIDNTEMNVDFIVGEPYDNSTMLKKFNYLNDSSAGSVIDLTAKRSVDVDISEQVAYVKLGDYVVRKFLVSSGTNSHPTPYGNYKILFKQQWRIGAKPPHYIMPKFQGFRTDGYGFHSLPSLGNAALRERIRKLGHDTPVPTEWFETDGMWSEARDHIGSRRSHGCVRFLPEDSDFVFDFTEVGTEINIRA